jgi:hypothetical protein
MGRGALEATVDVNGVSVTVVTAHFKSKLISYPRQAGVVEGSRFAPNDEGERLRYAGYAVYLRTAEAMTIRAHLDRLLADPDDPTGEGLGRSAAVVLCGDPPGSSWPCTPSRRTTGGPAPLSDQAPIESFLGTSRPNGRT